MAPEEPCCFPSVSTVLFTLRQNVQGQSGIHSSLDVDLTHVGVPGGLVECLALVRVPGEDM